MTWQFGAQQFAFMEVCKNKGFSEGLSTKTIKVDGLNNLHHQ